MRAAIDERKANTPGAAKRKRAELRTAMELKNYEFNAHGVELGQHYESAAVVGDGSAPPEPARDPVLYYQPDHHPGARLPHVWVGDDAAQAVHPRPRAVRAVHVLTGIAGEAWVAAAEAVAKRLDVPVAAVVIGPGRGRRPLLRLGRPREVNESGALLVRPDKHVGWRSAALPDDPEEALLAALRSILHRPA